LEATAALRSIRESAGVPIVLVSNRPYGETALLASRLGVDEFRSGFSAGDLELYMQDCRAGGSRTAFVGRCHTKASAAALAHVSVSYLAEAEAEADVDADPAAALLLQPRMELLAELWAVARSHEGRVGDVQKIIMLPNVLCVAGAFLLGFTGLTAVMLSNLGTFSLFQRAAGSLRALKPAGAGRIRHLCVPQ
jgi:Cu2+-exporting ATPase